MRKIDIIIGIIENEINCKIDEFDNYFEVSIIESHIDIFVLKEKLARRLPIRIFYTTMNTLKVYVYKYPRFYGKE